jgi:hypothetical protein
MISNTLLGKGQRYKGRGRALSRKKLQFWASMPCCCTADGLTNPAAAQDLIHPDMTGTLAVTQA